MVGYVNSGNSHASTSTRIDRAAPGLPFDEPGSCQSVQHLADRGRRDLEIAADFIERGRLAVDLAREVDEREVLALAGGGFGGLAWLRLRPVILFRR